MPAGISFSAREMVNLLIPATFRAVLNGKIIMPGEKERYTCLPGNLCRSTGKTKPGRAKKEF